VGVVSGVLHDGHAVVLRLPLLASSLPLAVSLAALVADIVDPVELVLDVGDVLLHVRGVYSYARLVPTAGDHGDHAGVLGAVLRLLLHQGGLGGAAREGEVTELTRMATMDGDDVARPGPVAGGPRHLVGDGEASPWSPVGRRGRYESWRWWRGWSGAAVHQQQPQPVLLHAGLVGGWGWTVLELAVHHPSVGVGGGGPGEGRAVEEPAVPVVVIAG